MNYRKLIIALFQLNMLFSFTVPDIYFGIADYWYFILLICIIGLYNYKPFLIQDRPVLNYSKILMALQITAGLISILVFGNVSSGYLFSYILWILFFFVCLNLRLNCNEIKEILSGYILSAVLIGLIMIFQRTDYYDGGEERFTIQVFGHEKFDPNFLAAYLIFPCIICFAKLLFKYKNKDLLFFLVIVIGVLMTASRTAMISIFVGIFFCLIANGFYFRNSKNLFNYTIIFGLLIFVVFQYLPEATFERLFVTSYSDDSNEKRFMNWHFGITAFLDRPILGYGMIGEMEAIKIATGYQRIAHNTYIALLMHYGIIGILFIILGFISLIIRIFKKKQLILLGCLLSLFLSSFVISAQVTLFFWTPLILITCCIQNIYRGNNKSFIEFI